MTATTPVAAAALTRGLIVCPKCALAWVLACGLVACADPGTGLPISDADASTFDDDTATGDVTSDAQPAGDGKICEPPSALGAPPLTLLDSFDVTLTEGAYYLTHLLDIEVDPASGRIYAAGVGGVCVFEDDGESVSLLGIIGDLQSPDRIELVGPDRYVASAPEGGLMVFDASDPAHPVKLGGKALLGASGAAWANGLLYQLTHTGSLLVLDVATGGPIPTLALVEGLAHPWDLTVEGDYAFVADHVMGLVVLDLTLPLEPTIVAVASELAGVHEVAVDGDRLYAAVGSAGLQIVDVSDPTSPILMGGVATGGALISVTPAGDRVWGADQRDVVVFDVADPDAPSLLAGHETDEWAMHVHADGDRAWVANWRKLDLYRHDPAVLAPKLRIEPGIIYVAAGQSAAQLSLRNQGGAPLEIAHIGATDPRIVIDAALPVVVPPGETLHVDVVIVIGEPGTPLQDGICVSSTDPDEPVQTILVSETSTHGAYALVGEAAPDFVLQNAWGEFFRLSDYLGQPVLLVFFSTW